MTSPEAPSNPWHGFIDVDGLVHDRAATRPHPSPYVGARVIDMGDLQALTAYPGPLRIRLDGGAGAIAPAARIIASTTQRVLALDLAVRDLLGPRDNVRRILAGATEAGLPDGIVVHVGAGESPSHSWLEAADELAAADQALIIDLDSPEVEAWIDAALDRELHFTVRGGTIEHAVEAVLTTARLWGDPGDIAAGRRWCRSWINDWHQTDQAVAHLESLEAVS